MQPEVITKTL